MIKYESEGSLLGTWLRLLAVLLLLVLLYFLFRAPLRRLLARFSSDNNQVALVTPTPTPTPTVTPTPAITPAPTTSPTPVPTPTAIVSYNLNGTPNTGPEDWPYALLAAIGVGAAIYTSKRRRSA